VQHKWKKDTKKVLKNKNLLENILNILLGVSWAIVFLGGLIGFKLMIYNGLLLAVVFSIVGILIGFIFVAIFEIALIQIKKYEQIKKQTNLLEKINDKLSNN
jgi:cytochrome c biogenesis protein CcdA